MTMAAEGELDLGVPSCLHLVSAFLAMEPSCVLISLARDCGGGSITERVQRFIWDHCICKSDGKSYAPYLKSFLKKLIVEVESQGFEVLDELYEQLAFYMTSLKDDDSAKGNSRVFKCISFLFSNDCYDLPSYPKSRKLVATLQCSLNMLEGDTGCSVWPSSLFLSEFILSCPQIFSSKSCFEVGSGVGLVGICLAHVKASKQIFQQAYRCLLLPNDNAHPSARYAFFYGKGNMDVSKTLLNLRKTFKFYQVTLSDGDLLSLENMKLNLGLNQLSTRVDSSATTIEEQNLVQCIHLPWEFSVGSELQEFMPDIILGADVIYDPTCLPHLVRVLAFLLNNGKSHSPLLSTECCNGIQSDAVHIKGVNASSGSDTRERATQNGLNFDYASKKGPVAFIASVIRNIDTFNLFIALADEANLSVEDVTEKFVLFNLLPYLQSYPRSSVRLFTLSHL